MNFCPSKNSSVRLYLGPIRYYHRKQLFLACCFGGAVVCTPRSAPLRLTCTPSVEQNKCCSFNELIHNFLRGNVSRNLWYTPNTIFEVLLVLDWWKLHCRLNLQFFFLCYSQKSVWSSAKVLAFKVLTKDCLGVFDQVLYCKWTLLSLKFSSIWNGHIILLAKNYYFLSFCCLFISHGSFLESFVS